MWRARCIAEKDLNEAGQARWSSLLTNFLVRPLAFQLKDLPLMHAAFDLHLCDWKTESEPGYTVGLEQEQITSGSLTSQISLYSLTFLSISRGCSLSLLAPELCSAIEDTNIWPQSQSSNPDGSKLWAGSNAVCSTMNFLHRAWKDLTSLRHALLAH
eukprot:1139168-Pelagomonas_calceolata.AAC.7